MFIIRDPWKSSDMKRRIFKLFGSYVFQVDSDASHTRLRDLGLGQGLHNNFDMYKWIGKILGMYIYELTCMCRVQDSQSQVQGQSHRIKTFITCVWLFTVALCPVNNSDMFCWILKLLSRNVRQMRWFVTYRNNCPKLMLTTGQCLVSLKNLDRHLRILK